MFTLYLRPSLNYKNKTRHAEGSVFPVSLASAPERAYELTINININHSTPGLTLISSSFPHRKLIYLNCSDHEND